MSLSKPNQRPHIVIAIDHLSSEQIGMLGQKINALPIKPIVTLVSAIPIVDEKNLLAAKARETLAKAKHDLNSPASGEIIHGSNPKNIQNFFMQGQFDVMINAKHAKPAAWVKHANTQDISALLGNMPVTEMIHAKPSYHGVFAGKASPATKSPVKPPLCRQEGKKFKL